MKGAAILVWALLIFTFLAVFMLTTVFVYRYRITIEIDYQYNYNNVQLALLSFLSSTHENEQMSEMLSDHVSMNKPMDIEIIQDRLDKIIDNKCYTLNVSNFSVVGNNIDCTKKYTATYKLPHPYNPRNITGDVSLVVG